MRLRGRGKGFTYGPTYGPTACLISRRLDTAWHCVRATCPDLGLCLPLRSDIPPSEQVAKNTVSKPLVIVESPTKARTIAGFLGKNADITVMSSVGHVRDLPNKREQLPEDKRESHARLLGVNPDDHFDVVYVVPPNKKKVISELRAALKNADEVYLATDEDREGEAIAWHLLETLKPKVPVKRMVFHEITPAAIQAAIDNPRDLDLKLVEAQEGRRVLDRLVGYEVSPVLWRKIGRGAPSAGRVQSVAVRLVVDRERARMAFRSGAWFDIEGAFAAVGVKFGATLSHLDDRRLASGSDFDAATGQLKESADVVRLDEAGAMALADRLARAEFRVQSIEAKPFTRRPFAPFTTSSLQQEGSRKLGFPASKTMAVAQRLYERGYITYMRTDSTNLSEQAITAARTAILERYGDKYLPNEARVYRSKVKNAQEAHEAIRPAGERIRMPEQVAGELDSDERRLYELIWVRTVACQMVDARGRTTTLLLGATSSANETAVFRATGTTWDFLGFRRAYVEGNDDEIDAGEEQEATLPAVTSGDSVACESLTPAGHATRPPARFTDASLVKELEERGIGRPSTYASVIQTIQDRGYVWRKGQALIPHWNAFAVINLLERHFGHLVDYGFTAAMEEALDVIARGEGESEKWLHSFYFGNGQVGLRELVEDEHLALIDPRSISIVPIGDDDGVPVIVRVGRYGAYVQRGEDAEGATASLPDEVIPDELTVEQAMELIARKAEGPRTIGNDPVTDKPIYVMAGPYGPYVQLGDQEDGKKKKPPRASLFKSMDVDTLSLDQALSLLTLPRIVGTDEEGREIVASPGRFGPYIRREDGETRSMVEEEQLLTITLEECLALLAQPKLRGRRAAKPPLLELGPSPETGGNIRVLEGRFGAYTTDGITNATIPRSTDPTTLTLEDAVILLRARAELNESSPRPTRGAKKTGVKKAAAKKSPAKKPAKKTSGIEKTVKKVVKKKSAAKKTASKKP